jgi:hypothetical protein
MGGGYAPWRGRAGGVNSTWSIADSCAMSRSDKRNWREPPPIVQRAKRCCTTYRLMRSFSTEGRKIWEICEPSKFPHKPCYLSRTEHSGVRAQRGEERNEVSTAELIWNFGWWEFYLGARSILLNFSTISF